MYKVATVYMFITFVVLFFVDQIMFSPEEAHLNAKLNYMNWSPSKSYQISVCATDLVQHTLVVNHVSSLIYIQSIVLQK